MQLREEARPAPSRYGGGKRGRRIRLQIRGSEAPGLEQH